jgi:hypothetical protein
VEKALTYYGFFEQERFSPLIINILVLLVILSTYSIIGGLLTLLVSDIILTDLTDQAQPFSLTINDDNLLAIRWVQFLAQLIIIAGPLLILVPLHTGQWRPFSALNRTFLGLKNTPSPKELFFASLTIILLHPLLSLVAELQLVTIDFIFGTGDELKADQKAFENMIKQLTIVRSPLEFMAVIGLIAVTPAICEELLFRGYVQKNFSRALSPLWTILLTGFIFGAFHLNLIEFLPLVVLGIYISYLRFRSDSLAVSMTAHFANNFFSIIVLLSTSGVEIVEIDVLQESAFSLVSLGVTFVTTTLCYLSFRAYNHETVKRVKSQ